MLKIHEVAKMLNVTPQTLRNWDKAGKLKPCYTAGNGYRYYDDDDIRAIMGKPIFKGKRVIGYCRVSSKKQEDDLIRQIDLTNAYLTAQGEPFEIITDIGSGINYNKKGLKKLIKLINDKEVSKVVVLHKDRLLRYGFELVEYIAELNSCSIEVINAVDKTDEEELVEDLVQIITVFGCKLQGKRSAVNRRLAKELGIDNKEV